MTQKKQEKTTRRINPSFYGILTSLLFIGVGFGWIHVTNLLNSIKGFGLGSIVKILPLLGVGVIVIGVLLLLLSLYQTFTKQFIVKEVKPAKKNQENQENKVVDIEVSSFEKKHIKGLVFDLDGTILNTIEDLADSGNYVLQKRGYPIRTVEHFEKSLGNGIHKLVERVLPQGVTPEEVESSYQEFLEVYAQRYMMKTRPYEGVKEMFQELVKRGYLLAIVTNKRDEFAENLIKQHFPETVFVDVIGEKEGAPKKPDPSLLKLVAQEMMISPNQLAMIGDSEVDIQTAHNVSALAIAVSWGFRDLHSLRQANPDYIINSPGECVMLLDEINKKDELSRPSQESEEIEIV